MNSQNKNKRKTNNTRAGETSKFFAKANDGKDEKSAKAKLFHGEQPNKTLNRKLSAGKSRKTITIPEGIKLKKVLSMNFKNFQKKELFEENSFGPSFKRA